MFLSKIRAGEADDRSPWSDFWFTPVAGRNTAAGIAVTPDRALQLTAVYACVRVRSESFSVMPPKVYRKDKATGRRKLLGEHWLYPLLRKPNPYQNGFEWRQMCQAHLDLRGNCFNLMDTDRRGNILSLLPLHPDRVRLVPIGESDYVYKYSQRDGTERTYSRADIWHMRTTMLDGYVGLSPVGMAREAIALGMAAQEYGGRFFQNDTRGGGIIKMPGNFKDKAQREQFRESFQEAQTGSNRHKTAVLEFGMEYMPLGATNKDSQFLEARGYTRTEIAGIYRVPPHMIGDLSRATFTNIEQQSLEFVTNCMTPTAELWEASIEADLLLEDEGNIDVEFDAARLLRGDQAARSAFYTAGINTGWLTRNEARDDDGREPIDGLDEPLRPLNMVEESDAATVQKAGKTKPAAPAQDPAPDDGDEPDARLAALIGGNARRMAKRISGGNLPSAEVLAEALAVPYQAAVDWLMSFGAHAPSGITEEQITSKLLEMAHAA
jgi:HK97 family phage portal protein